MMYSDCLDHDSHSSKWDRVRVNYPLLMRIIAIRESQNNFTTNNQFNQPKTLKDDTELHSSTRTVRQ
jgi:hypothetical protein